MTDFTVLCESLYDGISPVMQGNMTIVVRNGKIHSIAATTENDRLADNAICAPVVSPGLIDIQINGAADTQFNFTPTVAALKKIAWGARQGGTTHILPTFITAHGQAYRAAIHAVKQAMQEGEKSIIGIHLEGPFLSPARPGIHPPTAIRPLSEDDVLILEEEMRSFPGVMLLTLAPECQKPDYLERLQKCGIILFAGHSEAKVADMAFVQGVTHLWNAMPGLASRDAGIISEVLGGKRLYAGIIADGIHVGSHALNISVRAAHERLCLVTDAMMTLAGEADGFELDGRQIKLVDGRLTSAEGTLAGAHIAMDQSIQKLIELTDAEPLTALQMASKNPALALGLGDKFGRICTNLSANLSLMDENFCAIGTVVDGRYLSTGDQ